MFSILTPCPIAGKNLATTRADAPEVSLSSFVTSLAFSCTVGSFGERRRSPLTHASKANKVDCHDIPCCIGLFYYLICSPL